MSNKFIIYAIRWKHKPFVRLIWTTKNPIETDSTKVSRLSTILNHFRIVNYSPKAESKELKLFLAKNYKVIKNTKIKDVDFLELASLDLETITVEKINTELNHQSAMFLKDGFTVLNFNRYKVRLPKKKVSNVNQTPEYKPLLKDSVNVLVENLINDPEYLNSWHANIACAALDEGVVYESAQRIASCFLSNLTGGAVNSLANHNNLTGQKIVDPELTKETKQ